MYSLACFSKLPLYWSTAVFLTVNAGRNDCQWGLRQHPYLSLLSLMNLNVSHCAWPRHMGWQLGLAEQSNERRGRALGSSHGWSNSLSAPVVKQRKKKRLRRGYLSSNRVSTQPAQSLFPRRGVMPNCACPLKIACSSRERAQLKWKLPDLENMFLRQITVWKQIFFCLVQCDDIF